jgi:hypothetical protein
LTRNLDDARGDWVEMAKNTPKKTKSMKRVSKWFRGNGLEPEKGTDCSFLVTDQNVGIISRGASNPELGITISEKDVSTLIQVAGNPHLKVLLKTIENEDSSDDHPSITMYVDEWYVRLHRKYYHDVMVAEMNGKRGVWEVAVKAALERAGVEIDEFPSRAIRFSPALYNGRLGNNILAMRWDGDPKPNLSKKRVVHSGSSYDLVEVVDMIADAFLETYAAGDMVVWAVFSGAGYVEYNNRTFSFKRAVFKSTTGTKEASLNDKQKEYYFNPGENIAGEALACVSTEVLRHGKWIVSLFDDSGRQFGYVDGKGLEAAESLLVDTLLATVGGNRPGVKVSKVVAAILKQNDNLRREAKEKNAGEKDSDHSYDENTSSRNAEDSDG